MLAEIETDKATMEFEAVDDGRLGKDPLSRRARRGSRSISRSRCSSARVRIPPR